MRHDPAAPPPVVLECEDLAFDYDTHKDAFGLRDVSLRLRAGRALGVMNPLHIPIIATSAPLAGYISDTTGSYNGVFWMYGGCCAVAAIGLTIMGTIMKTPGHH